MWSIPAVLGAVLLVAHTAASDEYEWSLPAAVDHAVASPTDVCIYLSNDDGTFYRTEPWVGEKTFLLWTSGCIASATASDFGFAGPWEVVALNPVEGVVNAGTAVAPTLLYPSCWNTKVVAEVTVRSAGESGWLCFEPSPRTGLNCSRKCGGDYWYSHVYTGIATPDHPICEGYDSLTDCGTVPVDGSTWGEVKALYR